jgi:hypothetical protein
VRVGDLNPEERSGMAKRKSATEPASDPQPIVYTVDFSVPITLLAFREKDAANRVRFFGEALTALVDATAGEMFALGEATLTLRSAEPLPLAKP